MDPDPQKYKDPRIRIQGAKYQPKTAKKVSYSLNPNLSYWKKRLKKFPDFWMIHQFLAKIRKISEIK